MTLRPSLRSLGSHTGMGIVAILVALAAVQLRLRYNDSVAITKLHSKSDDAKLSALKVLANSRDISESLMEAIEDCTFDSQPAVRNAALATLASLCASDSRALLAMEKCAKRHPDSGTRALAITLISGRVSEDHVARAVVGWLADADPTVQWAAICAASKLASKGDDLMRAMQNVLNRSEGINRIYAGALLMEDRNWRHFGTSALADALLYGNSDEKVIAAIQLGCHGRFNGTADKSVMGLLAECCSDRDPSVRAACAQSLGQFGEVDEAAIRAIRMLLRDPNQMVRDYATQALGMLQVRDADIVADRKR